MRHLIESEELVKQIGGKHKILTCQYDNGKYPTNLPHAPIRVGAGDDILLIFPCEGCLDSLVAFAARVLLPAWVEKTKTTNSDRFFVYRGLVLSCKEGFVFPEAGKEEYKDIIQQIDLYIDENKPMTLEGIDMLRLVRSERNS